MPQKNSTDMIFQTSFFDKFPVPVWIYNKLTQRFIYLNKEALSKIGYLKDEFLNLKFDELVQTKGSGKKSSQKGYYKIRTKSGQFITAEVSSIKIPKNADLQMDLLTIVFSKYDKVDSEPQSLKNLEKTLVENKKQLELLKKIQTIFQTSHDLSSVFKNVYDILHDYLGGVENVRVNLFLYDREQDGLISEEYFGLSRFGKKGLAQPIGYSISGICFKEARPIIINDCTNTDLIPPKYVKQLKLKSSVSVPIIFKGTPTGVLRIDDLKRKNAFQNSDVELFILIAEQLGVVIENARLIEQQKEALESIEKVDKIYRETIANAQGLAYSFNFETQEYEFIAEECKQVLGISAEKFTREKLNEIIKERIVVDPLGPFDIKEYNKLFEEGLRERFQVHFKIITPAGERKWISDFALPIKDTETGIVKGYHGIMEDITVQKRNELVNEVLLLISSAIHSASTLDELYPLIHQALSKIIDTQNFYIALLDSGKKLISFPYASDLYDPPPWESIPSSNPGSLTAKLLKEPQTVLYYEEDLNKIFNKDKNEIWGVMAKCWLGATLSVKGVSIGAIGVQSYDDPYCYSEEDRVFLQSVAEQVAIAVVSKQSEDEIKKKNEQLKQSNREKDKLFSIVAHDLRSPFHGILGLTEIMMEDAAVLEKEEIEDYSKEIHKSASALFKFLENLLLWARMQQGAITVEPSVNELKLMVDKNIEFLSNNFNWKNIEIVNKISAGISVVADSEIFNIILRNLISNAVKFTHRGGRIEIFSSSEFNGFITVSVRDNGIGISKSNLDKLFRIDAKVSTAGTEGESSSGLGLLLCKDLIEKMGGKIWAESKPNSGSTFHINIPAEK